jgi:predicted TIM-barrel fold metal-dependent hydrolase
MSPSPVRAKLSHPVIDADGHFVELMPALAGFMADEGIGDMAELWTLTSAGFGTGRFDRMTPEQRAAARAVRGPWWALPAENTLDLATATLPALLHERLDELGIDFAVLYPSAGLAYAHVQDERKRIAACRALNRYSAEAFGECADRVTPAAVIPMHTPQEAIEQLEHAVELGLRAAMIASFVERAVPQAEGTPYNVWWDTFGLDSAHDYDPFWKRCLELGVSPATHSGSMGIGFRRSTSNYMHNHIGHFGAAGEAICKSLFLGGVTRRFPGLRVAFLEGGVHWGVGLYGDLIARFEKRNVRAVRRYDPGAIDGARYRELLNKYGGKLLARTAGRDPLQGLPQNLPQPCDDFALCGIERPEDVRDQFVPNFYFGCEADDPMTATAFDRRRIPFGVQLNAMFSSDIGHWDVPDMAHVLEEAWENVEHGWLDREQFRDFAFANAARFYLSTNPAFFRGTRVEREVAALL